jgi:hypothetical protein
MYSSSSILQEQVKEQQKGNAYTEDEMPVVFRKKECSGGGTLKQQLILRTLKIAKTYALNCENTELSRHRRLKSTNVHS